MKNLIIICLTILILSTKLWAADTDYYVTQSGASGRDGLAIGTAWSVSDFNSSANWSATESASDIDPGDTVYFSGTITTTINPPDAYGGTSGNYITLDGWEAGTCNPVANHDATTFGSDNDTDLNACPSAAEVDVNSIYNQGIQLDWNSYLIVQDFHIHDANHGILLKEGAGTPDHTIIRRNYVHDTYNKCFDMEGDDWHWVTVGGALNDGNFFYNCAEHNRSGGNSSGDIGLYGDDLIFSHNEASNDFQTDESHNVVNIFTGDRQLIEYNTISYPSPQSGIVPKANGGHDKIIRFNRVSNCKWGISISTILGEGNHDIYVYGNFVHDLSDAVAYDNYAAGIRVWRWFSNAHVWSNIVSLSDGRGIWIGKQDGYSQGAAYVYNNTIYKTGQYNVANDRDKAALFFEETGDALNLHVANNIVSESDPYGYYAIYNSNVEDGLITTFSNNTYYFTGHTPQAYWDGTAGADLMTALTVQGWGANGEVDNPDFTSPNGTDTNAGTPDDDFTLQGVSPAIDSGLDVSGCNTVVVQDRSIEMCHEDALDPAVTDWTTTPPTIGITDRDVEGWSRGAYSYSPEPAGLPPAIRMFYLD